MGFTPWVNLLSVSSLLSSFLSCRCLLSIGLGSAPSAGQCPHWILPQAGRSREQGPAPCVWHRAPVWWLAVRSPSARRSGRSRAAPSSTLCFFRWSDWLVRWQLVHPARSGSSDSLCSLMESSLTLGWEPAGSGFACAASSGQCASQCWKSASLSAASSTETLPCQTSETRTELARLAIASHQCKIEENWDHHRLDYAPSFYVSLSERPESLCSALFIHLATVNSLLAR